MPWCWSGGQRCPHQFSATFKYDHLFLEEKQFLTGVSSMEESSRPLDMLNASRNKTVLVELKNGYRYVGKLEAFDIHINIVLNNAEEQFEGATKRKLGTVFIRGDGITTLVPAQD